MGNQEFLLTTQNILFGEKRFPLYLTCTLWMMRSNWVFLKEEIRHHENKSLIMFTCVIPHYAPWKEQALVLPWLHEGSDCLSCPRREANTELSGKGTFHSFPSAKVAFQGNLYSGNYAWTPITGKKNWDDPHFWMGSTRPLRPLAFSP